MREISGDNPLSLTGKLSYLARNFIRGISGFSFALKSTYWRPTDLDRTLSSPGRKYFARFIQTELPNLPTAGEIDVLDVGCGNGFLGGVLSQGGMSGNYTGLDIYKDKNFDPASMPGFQVDFVLSGIEDFKTDKSFDLVISCTALEHIQDDMLAVQICDGLLKPGGFQVHIVPSFWSLFLYLFHGYRQYTPKRILKLFQSESCRVYRLGGLFSFLLHFGFITVPNKFLKTDRFRQLKIYPGLVRLCNKLDRVIPFCSYTYLIVAGKNNRGPVAGET